MIPFEKLGGDAMMTRTARTTQPIGASAIRPIAIGVGLAATSAALFGAAFGTLGTQVGWNVGSIYWVAAYFAVCGAIAGGLVGMVCAVVEISGSAESGHASSLGAGRQQPTRVNPLISRWNYVESAAADDIRDHDEEFLKNTRRSTSPANGALRNGNRARYEARLEQMLALRQRPLRGV
jgi:hypothetical protein